MNILLVYPKYPKNFWSFKPVKIIVGIKSLMPPLGLLTVASLLPANWNKKFIDNNVDELKQKHIKWADMIFISALLIQFVATQEIIDKCKAQGKTVVAGGPCFNSAHMDFKNVDHYILNEAEITLPLFLEDLKRGKAQPIYTSKEKPDIIKTPIPSWSLIKVKHYYMLPIQYSRGCPFNCEFCDIIMQYGRIPRCKTPQQIINEMQALYNTGWRGQVFFVDDNFIGNKKETKKMLSLLTRWQKKNSYPFKFITETSIDLALDKDLIELLKEANFNIIFIGIESLSPDTIKECGKLQNLRINPLDAVKTLQKNGLQVMAGFIIGFDNDTELVFDELIKFINKSGIVNSMIKILYAIPNTKLWQRLQKEHRLLPMDYNLMSKNAHDGYVNFKPKMGKDPLINGFKKIIKNIYSPEQYFQRLELFINNYTPTQKNRLKKNEILSAFKIFFKLCILLKEKKYIWKIIYITLTTKPKAFPEVIYLMLTYLHFKEYAREVAKN